MSGNSSVMKRLQKEALVPHMTSKCLLGVVLCFGLHLAVLIAILLCFRKCELQATTWCHNTLTRGAHTVWIVPSADLLSEISQVWIAESATWDSSGIYSSRWRSQAFSFSYSAWSQKGSAEDLSCSFNSTRRVMACPCTFILYRIRHACTCTMWRQIFMPPKAACLLQASFLLSRACLQTSVHAFNVQCTLCLSYAVAGGCAKWDFRGVSLRRNCVHSLASLKLISFSTLAELRSKDRDCQLLVKVAEPGQGL